MFNGTHIFRVPTPYKFILYFSYLNNTLEIVQMQFYYFIFGLNEAI